MNIEYVLLRLVQKMIIQHNMMAQNTMRNLGLSTKDISEATKKLSSGYKVNKAADDAAALAITEGMRAQIRGLDQSVSNMNDAQSFIQVADGALSEVHSILKRGTELSVQAANDTLTYEDRQVIQLEVNQLLDELNRINEQTEFNTIPVFTDKQPVSTASTLSEEVLYKLATDWVPNAVDSIYSTFSALNGTGLNINMNVTNSSDGAYNVLAYMGLTASGGTITSYTLNVDLADITSDSDTDTVAGIYYDQIIGHEMMHASMAGALDAMLGFNGVNPLPLWFIEGSAEAVGGGMDRIRFMSNAAVQANLGNGGFEYSSGYAATMYIGYLAGGSNINNIANGLNDVYTRLKNGDDLDQALNATIGMGEAAFVTKFRNVSDTSVTNFLSLLRTTAGSGAGSVLAGNSLSTSGDNVIKNGFQNQTSWIIDISSVTDGSDINEGNLWIQTGSNTMQGGFLERFNVGSKALGLGIASVDSHQSSNQTLEKFNVASERVSNIRSYYGAKSNSYNHNISSNEFTSENTSAAESKLRDTDMAKVMVDYSKNNILMQSAQAMLAQANKMTSGVLDLLN